MLDRDRAAFKVDAVPCKPQHLALAHSCKKSYEINEFIFGTIDRVKEGGHFLVSEGLYLGLLNLGQVGLVCRVVPDIAERNGFFKCLMQRPVNILL